MHVETGEYFHEYTAQICHKLAFSIQIYNSQICLATFNPSQNMSPMYMSTMHSSTFSHLFRQIILVIDSYLWTDSLHSLILQASKCFSCIMTTTITEAFQIFLLIINFHCCQKTIMFLSVKLVFKYTLKDTYKKYFEAVVSYQTNIYIFKAVE